MEVLEELKFMAFLFFDKIIEINEVFVAVS